MSSQPKIAIVAALEREVSPLIKHWASRKVVFEGREFTFYESDYATVVCGGIGAACARRAAEAAIANYSPELLISAGIAGAARPELHVGDTVFPTAVVDVKDGSRHETAIRSAPIGTTSLGRTVVATYPEIASCVQKRHLAKSYGAHVVDMEAAGVARAAQAHNLPFLVVKAISDEVHFDISELNRFVRGGQFATQALVFHLTLRPWLWVKMLRLARNTQLASDNLCAWLRESALTNTIIPGVLKSTGAQTRHGDKSVRPKHLVNMTIAEQLTSTQVPSKIPTTMLAAVYRGKGDVRLETVPVPEIGPGEILIKVHTCGICGTDLKKIATGSHSAPRIFGHETSGTVAAVGDQVTRFVPGDRVMVFHHIPCGYCYYCRNKTFAQCETYKRVGCTAGFEPSGGGFAEYVRVMNWVVEKGTVRIPEGVSFEQAAFVEPLNTCLKGIERLSLQSGETVLVIGQGPIGIILSLLAKRAGAGVITSDLYDQRLTISKEFGLENTINAGRADVVQESRRQTEGRGADVAILAVGGNGLIRTAMDAVRPGGRVLLFAQTQHGEAIFDPAAVCMDEKTLMGSYSASVDLQEESVRIVMSGELALEKLVSHRFPLVRAVEALELAAHPQPDSMKIVIQPGN